MLSSSFTTLLTLLSIIIAHSEAFPQQGKNKTEYDLNKAIFATSNDIKVENNHKSLGLAGNMSNGGLGLSFHQFISSDKRIFSVLTYDAKSLVIPKTITPSDQVAYTEIYEKDRFRFSLGADQLVHVTSNKFWGFFVGLSAAVNHSRYEAKYYRQLCTFFCGFDRNSPTQKDHTDFFGSVMGRLGVTTLKTKIWGVTGDLSISATPILKRWPQEIKFIGPGGKEVPVYESIDILIEGTVHL